MPEEPTRPVRVGIVGCGEGTHGKVWAEMLAAPGGERFGIVPARVWDADPAAADAVAGATGAVRVEDPSQAGEGMDGVLITELLPARYLELSRPFLKAGMRVFYNRPFAGSVTDAHEILRLAREYGARVYSASALFHTAAGDAARERLPGLGGARLFHVTGPTDHLGFYLPHCVACLVSVLGIGVSRVQALSLTPRTGEPQCAEAPVVVYVEYGPEAAVGPARGTLSMLGPGAQWYGFVLKVYGATAEGEETHYEVSYDRLLDTMARFFRTGAEPIAHEVLLETTAIYYAALESARDGGRAVLLR
jgi:predicted dehydrogenase